jgi:hypothetical protein
MAMAIDSVTNLMISISIFIAEIDPYHHLLAGENHPFIHSRRRTNHPKHGCTTNYMASIWQFKSE